MRKRHILSHIVKLQQIFHLGAGGVASLLERGEGQDRGVRGAVGQAQGRLC